MFGKNEEIKYEAHKKDIVFLRPDNRRRDYWEVVFCYLLLPKRFLIFLIIFIPMIMPSNTIIPRLKACMKLLLLRVAGAKGAATLRAVCAIRFFCSLISCKREAFCCINWSNDSGKTGDAEAGRVCRLEAVIRGCLAYRNFS